ncbi:hypothetical protein GWK08_08345 [Leptobacterium flavescens]|uniref:LTD domain-containing protein n=1 Tax=Leptobacterium flavescens TaxID=472055 RepID=A0A6P0ULN8_9FLAO|nr:lamin tail domain-containing protein [Leptobacterium flavescens]NER13442.1 hypothetical protein [Leptobacterium flavescens]
MKKYLLVLTVIFAAWSCSGDDDGGTPPPPPSGNPSVVINEVAYLGDEVELFNNGNVNVDLSSYFLCLGPGTYRRIGDLQLQGNANLAPGEYLVITYAMPRAEGGLGLYRNNSDFADPDTLADFVQWGVDGSPRENVAVAAGIWTAGEFVEVVSDADNSIAFDGNGNAASDWAETTTPTLGAANSVTPPVRSVVINEVEYLVDDQIELYNSGDTPVDLTDYWLCFGPGAYFRIGDPAMTDIISGNISLAPGEFLVVSAVNLDAPDAAGAIGLYINDSNFADSSTIRDFVQWGAAGNARESVAVDAGIWDAGGFVPNVAVGSSIAYDGTGDTSADWSEDTTPTLGSGNN